MTGISLIVAVTFLLLIGALCIFGIVSDFRSGSTRMAHEDVSYSRRDLPLNFWMSIGSKAAGAIVAYGLCAALIL